MESTLVIRFEARTPGLGESLGDVPIREDAGDLADVPPLADPGAVVALGDLPDPGAVVALGDLPDPGAVVGLGATRVALGDAPGEADIFLLAENDECTLNS